MSDAAGAFDPAQLDTFRPATVDPRVWTANLTALATDEPEFAEALRRLELPASWRPAVALDDSLTYRLEEAGQPPTWLGNTAAPRARAASLLERYDHSGRNPALPTCAAGAELRYLLDRLPQHLAVFVFETDTRALSAVLHLVDLAAPLQSGRCLLLPPGREAERLRELLEIQVGLLPPGDMLLPDLVSAERSRELRTICEQVMTEALGRRNTQLNELHSKWEEQKTPSAAPASGNSAPRVAVLSLVPHPPTHALAACLQRAAQTLGWPVACRTVAEPRSVHPLVHARALANFVPDITIAVDHPRALLAAALPGRVCTWVLDERSVPSPLPPEDTLYLAASPRIAAALRRAGAPETALLDWYWACDPAAAEPPQSGREPLVLMVADLPDHRPESYGIEHTAHKLLWEHLLTAAARQWETPRILEPEKLLVQVELECRVNLTDAPLRQAFARLIEHVVVPTVVVEQLVRALGDKGVHVQTLGRGWERLASRAVEPLAADLFDLQAAGRHVHPQAAIFAGNRDPLGAALLYAAQQGWPLLLHHPGKRPLGEALGGVLHPGQHYEPFVDVTDMWRALRLMHEGSPAIQRRIERTRAHVGREHSYARRLETLWARVRPPSAPRRD